MKTEYRDLRVRQLDESLAALATAKTVMRPVYGWLRAIREALGLTLERVAVRAKTSKQHIRKLEKAEANDRITLRNLRRVANAMSCELVYAIVPKTGSIEELAEKRARKEATQRVLSVERTMALEDQAPGGVKELIEKEIKRTKKR